MRTCEGCKKKDEKDRFLRFVLFEGKPVLDLTGKLPGRGYNVCPNKECIRKFLKKRFKGKVDSEEIFNSVETALKDYLLHLLSLCHKTGITVVGQDNVKNFKKKEGVLFLSKDLSTKTKERLRDCPTLILEEFFSSEELGNALRKERTAGVVFVEKVGLGRKLYSSAEKLLRLKGNR